MPQRQLLKKKILPSISKYEPFWLGASVRLLLTCWPGVVHNLQAPAEHQDTGPRGPSTEAGHGGHFSRGGAMHAKGSRAGPRINSTGGPVGRRGRRRPRKAAGARMLGPGHPSPPVLTACQLTTSLAEARWGLRPAHPASPQRLHSFL